jgi:hypothetical protein
MPRFASTSIDYGVSSSTASASFRGGLFLTAIIGSTLQTTARIKS